MGTADYFTGHGVTIHASARFPVVRTVCGAIGPAAGEWRYVGCIACLRIGAARSKDPRVAQRLSEVEAEMTATR
jgi:hypothetical protein